MDKGNLNNIVLSSMKHSISFMVLLTQRTEPYVSHCGSFRIGAIRQLQVRDGGVGSVVLMASTKKSTARITLRTVLEHVQAQGAKLVSLEKEMKKEFKIVNEKIEGAERRLTRQIDGIDERLDDVEVTEIPKLKKAVAAR